MTNRRRRTSPYGLLGRTSRGVALGFNLFGFDSPQLAAFIGSIVLFFLCLFMVIML